MNNLLQKLFYSSNLGYHCVRVLISLKKLFSEGRFYSDEYWIKKQFRRAHGYDLNLKSPLTLNEKIQWLKLNDRKPIYTFYADKYAVREIIKKRYGAEYLVDLLFVTTDIKKIRLENMPNVPFIIKPNHGSGWYFIVDNKNSVNWKRIRLTCRYWMSENYYYSSREWQYKNISPCILVEKLLVCKNGGIPINYRFHCINGQVQFISINIYSGKDVHTYKCNRYDRNWKPLYFTHEPKGTDLSQVRGPEVPPPLALDKMLYIAEDIAKEFKYVRVDFYDVDGKPYFGEITLHHAGGYDVFTPNEWDFKLGKMIDL